ncbi:hypothetical protein [Halolactibacillus sp. JCM 19043]|nr:hypothetical protein [Halolactibacillus sp. JCM 19043]
MVSSINDYVELELLKKLAEADVSDNKVGPIEDTIDALRKELLSRDYSDV